MLNWLRTVLLASDPGWQRARSAGRAAFTVAGAFFAADGIAKLAGQPITVALLSAVVGMLTTMAVNDPEPRQRMITMVLVPFAAAPVMALGGALGAYPWAADAAFVLVMALVTYARRFGPRAMALGMVSYMAFFFTLFLGARLSQLPWLVVSAFTGVAVAAVARFAVIRDSTAHSGEQACRTLLGRVARLLDAVASLLTHGPDRRHRRRVRRRAADLNEGCLVVEAQLGEAVGDGAHPGPAADAGALPGATADEEAQPVDTGPERVRGWIFDLEIAVDYVAETAVRAAADAAGHAAADRLVQVLPAMARSLRREDLDAMPALTGTSGSRTMQAAVQHLAQTLAAVPSPFPRLAAPGRRPGVVAATSTTRPAVQVAVAAALAIAAGSFVSPTRWFYAVITAFTVFSNAATAGATIFRALQRVAGTALGVAAGLVIAAALSGHTYAELGLLFACVFVAFYYVQTAYHVMSLFMTIMVSLLYSLLGEFSFSLLSLRLEETAIGAVIGGVVALTVLPQRGGESISNHISSALSETADLLEAVASPAANGNETQRPAEHARNIDRTYQQLRTLTTPAFVLPGARSQQVRRALVAAGALAYHARVIAARAPLPAYFAQAHIIAQHARRTASQFGAAAEPADGGPDGRSRDDPGDDRLRDIDQVISYLAALTGTPNIGGDSEPGHTGGMVSGR